MANLSSNTLRCAERARCQMYSRSAAAAALCGASAAADVPRRCRGLTEGVTACAVRMRRRVSRMRSAGRSGRRCATTGDAEWSAGRTRFQLTPDSASGDRVEREICTARRCRCRCIAGVRRRRRSAAHLRRLMSPDAVGGDGATRPLARSDSASGGVAHVRCAVGWGRGG